jgi:hypothetical protein
LASRRGVEVFIFPRWSPRGGIGQRIWQG